MTRLVGCLGILLAVSAALAQGFNYAGYQPGDLDALAAQPRPETGADIVGGRPLRFEVTLVAYPEPCETGFLKRAMIVSGFPREQVNATEITGCIKVRSAKGTIVPFFFQDQLTAGLRRDVALGGPLTLFATHVYSSRAVLGVLVNGFVTGHNVDVSTAPADQAAGSLPPCACGSDQHSGVDWTAAEGTPIPAAAAGIVVKVEENQEAVVDVPSAGRCGRYVVLRHTHKDGRVVFSRYAQLGRLVGRDGKALRAGMRVAKGDQIGEVGSGKTLHFEVRPLDRGKMDTSPAWSRRYGADPAMEWSRYQPGDPQTFDLEGYGAPTAAR